MKIDEYMTAEVVIERILRRYSICTECASDARKQALTESDRDQRIIWEKCAGFHETRADVIFDILVSVAGSEELAREWIKEYDS